ncbi:hypothetical protein R3P38DRAFT_3170723 [Favolaschia claudopus]|uniref:Uncharacterized protein n=1 Tax=Favolaschia claudopus TaxID=2862362 RepID=A0AAW0DZ00_9AGAR
MPTRCISDPHCKLHTATAIARDPNMTPGAESSLSTYLRSSRHLFVKLPPEPSNPTQSIRNTAAPHPLSLTASIRSWRGAAISSFRPIPCFNALPKAAPQLQNEFSAMSLSRPP